MSNIVTSDSSYPVIKQRHFYILAVILLILGVSIATSGTLTLPPDDHEIFVVRTAQEMHNRDNWIVPYFNGEPRLNKPPLSYWLTGFVATLDNSVNNIQFLHGRIVSIMSSLCIAILLLIIGHKLYDDLTALIAASLFITSQCYFTYAHDARPDMLYAFFCTLAIAGHVYAIKTRNYLKFYYAHLAWLAYALAILTKGPQLPVIILAASIAFLLIRRYSWEDIIKTIQPFSGILLILLITVPWWVIVNDSLNGEGLANSQLTGTLLAIDWSNIIKGYYLYRSLLLFLPWTFIMPFVFILLYKHWRIDDGLLLFSLIFLTASLVLGLGTQQRWYYMLPVTPVIFLLFAVCIKYSLTYSSNKALNLLRRSSIGFYLIIAVCMTLILHYKSESGEIRTEIILISLFLFSSLIIIYTMHNQDSNRAYIKQLFSVIITIGFTLILFGKTNILWSDDRFTRANLAVNSNTILSDDIRLLSWNVTPNVYIYYTNKEIKQVKSAKQIESILTNSIDNEIAVLLPYNHIDQLPANFNIDIFNPNVTKKDKDPVLVKLQKKSSPLITTSH